MKKKNVYKRRHRLSKKEKIKKMSLSEKAEAAMKEAIRKVIIEHRKSGRRLAVWKNGKVALISPWSVK